MLCQPVTGDNVAARTAGLIPAVSHVARLRDSRDWRGAFDRKNLCNTQNVATYAAQVVSQTDDCVLRPSFKFSRNLIASRN